MGQVKKRAFGDIAKGAVPAPTGCITTALEFAV